MPPLAGSATPETVRALTEQIRNLESHHQVLSHAVVTSGIAALDGLLPEQGLRRGTLVEWLFREPGGGAGTLALLAAREVCREGGSLVVVDRNRSFYAPGAAYWGIDLQRLIVVRPQNDLDDAWAWDQALRSAAVAAVWGWPHLQDEQTLRRWQLAAEASGAMGLLLRPEQVRADPSWAEVRLLVEPVPMPHTPGEAWRRRLRVELLRARGAVAGGVIECELNEEQRRAVEQESSDEEPSTTTSSRMRLATQLAHSTPRRRWGRA